VASFVFNVAKGSIAYYAGLPAASDRLVAIPIEASGVVSDATMVDYDDVATLLAGATNEQTTMGRKTLASVTVTVDDTNDRVNIDCADITWTAATGNAISDILIAYDPTGASADSALVPLTFHDFSATPDGTDITATVSDFARAG